LGNDKGEGCDRVQRKKLNGALKRDEGVKNGVPKQKKSENESKM